MTHTLMYASTQGTSILLKVDLSVGQVDIPVSTGLAKQKNNSLGNVISCLRNLDN